MGPWKPASITGLKKASDGRGRRTGWGPWDDGWGGEWGQERELTQVN